MAAHLKTGLEEIARHIEAGTIEQFKPHLATACNLSCFTEDDYDTWTHIWKFVQGEIEQFDFEQFMYDDLARATELWEKLGKPATREEWFRAKYPELRDVRF